MEDAIVLTYEISPDVFTRAGEASSDVKRKLKQMGVNPEAIRKVIYTTNAIESLNSVIRHAIKKRKVFPTDESVKKVVWLAIQSASQKWTMPLQDWRIVMSRFIIEFGDRPDGHF